MIDIDGIALYHPHVLCSSSILTFDLIYQVLVQQVEFSESNQGKLFLDSIQATGRSKLHDPISVHLILNILLRPDSQITLFPVVAFKDQELDLSEREFVGACRHLEIPPGAKNTLSGIFDGSIMSSQERAITHRGELFFDFFLKSKNTSYRRGAVLMNPARNTDRTLLDLDSRQRIQPELEHLDGYSSMDKTICSLLRECSSMAKNPDPELAAAQNLIQRISAIHDHWTQLPGNPILTIGLVNASSQTTDESIADTMKSMEVKLRQMRDTLSNLSTAQRRQLQDVIRHGLQSGPSNNAENKPRRHYVPTGSIKTDGHRLHVLAYDLTTLCAKKSTKSDSGPTSSGPQHSLPVATPEEAHTAQSSAQPSAQPLAQIPAQPQPMDVFDMELWNTADPLLEESLFGNEAGPNEGLSVDHGLPERGSTVQRSFAGAKASAVHAKTLPYVRDLFSTRKHVQSLGGPHFIGIGIDPGRAKPASVVAVHTKYPNFSQTLDITDTAAKDIHRRYMRCLNLSKTTHGIDKLESTLIAKVTPVQVKVTQENGTTICDWRAAANVLYNNHTEWLSPRLAAFKELRVFYGSISFKKDLYDLKTAIRSDRSSVCSAAIKMAHIPHPKIRPSEVQEYRDTPAVLGVGDGAFTGRKEKTLDEVAQVVSVGGLDFQRKDKGGFILTSLSLYIAGDCQRHPSGEASRVSVQSVLLPVSLQGSTERQVNPL